MLKPKLILLCAALSFSVGARAQGEWRCDCTTVVDSCSAAIAIQGNWVEITSDQAQCSRVDYFIDGLPFVAVVVDGQTRQDWISRSQDPNVLVQSCQVCRDNASNAPTVAADPGSTQEGEKGLQPLIQVAPSYPEQAHAQGIEGHVVVEFTIDEFGSIDNIAVVESEPTGVFDQAALEAVQRWRYPTNSAPGAPPVRELVEFTLDDYIFQLNAPSIGTATPEPVSSTPRNDCVRENIAYNYGEMVEVGLINACTEPLLVFGCAQGTGRHVGNWVCIDSERLRSVLVRPGDGRLGNTTFVDTFTGQRSFYYGDSFFVARAPNTQYWWIACNATDNECRDVARQWTRAIDRQPVTVDPQGRSSLVVARSY